MCVVPVVMMQSRLGEAPLHRAAARGNTLVVQELLARGADRSIVDSQQHTSLYGGTWWRTAITCAGTWLGRACTPTRRIYSRAHRKPSSRELWPIRII